MEIRVKVKVIRKKSGKGVSHIVHIPKIIYELMGEPEYIVWVVTPFGIKIEPK